MPASPALGELEEEFLLMAAMRDMPHLPGGYDGDLPVPFLTDLFLMAKMRV